MHMLSVANFQNGGQAKGGNKKKQFCNEYSTYASIRKANLRMKKFKMVSVFTKPDVNTREVGLNTR